MPVNLEELLTHAKRDAALSTSAGVPLPSLPDGALMRDLPNFPDDRGQIVELYDPRWNFHPAPLVQAYFCTLNARSAKGWAVHLGHEDRYAMVRGEMQVLLYDSRPETSTFGWFFELHLTERRPTMLTIPTGVWHADYNSSDNECIFANFPTVAYNHQDPDKYRLPLRTPLIPFEFPADIDGY